MISLVLIAGGTGRLGSLVVQRLAARGLRVRVMTRDPLRAAHLSGPQVEIVPGDVRNPGEVTTAASGVELVISAVQGFAGPGGGSPSTVDRNGNMTLIRAAEAAGAEMVLMSVVGSAPDSPFELFRMKHAAEVALAESALPATVVRATAFVELWIELLISTAGRSNRPLVFGRGANPINFVSVRDVAALMEQVVTDPTTRGRTEQIGGPDDITMTELARMVSAWQGEATEPRHVPRPALHAMAATVGRLRPELGRQARAALVMDTADLTFDPGVDVRDRLTNITCTSASQVLRELPRAGRPVRHASGGQS